MSRLYETVEEMAEKPRTLELSQMKRDEELKEIKQQNRVGKTTQIMPFDSHKPLVPSLPKPIPRQITQPNSDLPTVPPQDIQGAWHHPFSNDGDKLWASLEKIDQLA